MQEQLENISTRIRAHDTQRAALLIERDNLIREARDTMTWADITAATGLSLRAVQQSLTRSKT